MEQTATKGSTVDSTQGCSRCKGEIWNTSDSKSIHTILAYTRCRCHRSFSYQTKQPTCISKASMPDSIPTSLGILSHRKIHMDDSDPSNLHSKHVPAPPVDDQMVHKNFTLPPIDKQRLPAADQFNFRCSDRCEDATTGVTLTHHSKTKADALKSSQILPQLNRKFEDTSCQKQRKSKGDVSQLLNLVHYIPQRKKKEVHSLFKYFDTDGDGHLSLVQFMDVIPIIHINKSDEAFLKQLHVKLSNETYFGTKEFTLGYCIAETLSKGSISKDREYEVKENFVDILTLFITMLTRKSSEDGFVSTATVMEAIRLTRTLYHNLRVLPAALAEIAKEGRLHLLQCLSLAPYFLSIP